METEKLTMTVEEAARLLGISRGLAYEMVKIGKIPSNKVRETSASAATRS